MDIADAVNAIEVSSVSKTFFGEKGMVVKALDAICLDIRPHEFVCILGSSGCGKSTLLNLMAGLISADGGMIKVLGNTIKKPIREAQMVFQEYSLLPWRTVLDNVSLSLELGGVSKKERHHRARQLLNSFGLDEFCNSYPHELSGGMRQRAAIARALSTGPDVLYMDEPFGALDAHTRLKMQQELLNYWLGEKKTVVFVTHSVEEAVFLGTRIIVLGGRPGTIRKDIAIELNYPRNRWHSEFGDYCSSLLQAMESP
ncbi:MAG: ABC transporter ATP-binding protein [Oscillospiraceae bacterium]|nr:ABC transporter ATP-binding protein [Oscillospiraceae bacterium]